MGLIFAQGHSDHMKPLLFRTAALNTSGVKTFRCKIVTPLEGSPHEHVRVKSKLALSRRQLKYELSPSVKSPAQSNISESEHQLCQKLDHTNIFLSNESLENPAVISKSPASVEILGFECNYSMTT